MRRASRKRSRNVGGRSRHHAHIAHMTSANVGERVTEGRVAKLGNGLQW